VITGETKRGGNAIVFRCQIGRGGELRLAAMATVVDDEVLCDALGNSETMIVIRPFNCSLLSS